MARMEDEEAIFEGDEEIRRRKRANDDKDARPIKKTKVEGNKAAELPVCLGRNLVNEAGEKAATVCDGELNTSTRDKTKDDNAVIGDELKRLFGLLADGPKKLGNKDVEDVIRYLEVDEIISQALKSGQEKRNNDRDTDEEEFVCIDNRFVPSPGKVFGLLRLMLRRVEKLKKADIWLLYQNFPKRAFASLLLIALESYSNRCCRDFPLLKMDRDTIHELCRVLPWKLFVHILSYKTSLPIFKSTSEESDEECTAVQKKAAESCSVCFGKGKHSGLYGYHCSFWDSLPKGVTVGPNYLIHCADCKEMNNNPVEECSFCGSEVGKAIPTFIHWKI